MLILLILLPIFAIKFKVSGLEHYISYYGLLVTSALVFFQIKKSYEDNLKIEMIKEDDEIVFCFEGIKFSELNKYGIYLTEEGTDKFKEFIKDIRENQNTNTFRPYFVIKTKYEKNLYDIKITFKYKNCPDLNEENLIIEKLNNEKKVILPLGLFSTKSYIYYNYQFIEEIIIEYQTFLDKNRKIDKYKLVAISKENNPNNKTLFLYKEDNLNEKMNYSKERNIYF